MVSLKSLEVRLQPFDLVSYDTNLFVLLIKLVIESFLLLLYRRLHSVAELLLELGLHLRLELALKLFSDFSFQA